MITWAAFTSWMRGVPQWVWLGLLAAVGIAMLRHDARRDGHREAARKIKNDIEEQTDERQQAARSERDRVADLNDEQLRKLRANDPNNRLRVR